jgi:hypothetical protein
MNQRNALTFVFAAAAVYSAYMAVSSYVRFRKLDDKYPMASACALRGSFCAVAGDEMKSYARETRDLVMPMAWGPVGGVVLGLLARERFRKEREERRDNPPEAPKKKPSHLRLVK